MMTVAIVNTNTVISNLMSDALAPMLSILFLVFLYVCVGGGCPGYKAIW